MAGTDLIKSLFSRRLTHTGIVRGADCRTPDDYRRAVKLRRKGPLWIARLAATQAGHGLRATASDFAGSFAAAVERGG
jgi:hypothetical protein